MEPAGTPLRAFLLQFKGRNHGHLVQFIKYAIAGGIATVVHLGIFYAMAWKVFPALTQSDPVARFLEVRTDHISDATRAWFYLIDYFIAFMISNFVVYVINVRWVFETGRHSKRKEIGLFYLVSGISVGIGVALAWALIRFTGLATTPTFIINVLVCLLINYAMRKFVIFKG